MCKTQITTVGQTSEGLDLRRQQLTKLRLMKMVDQKERTDGASVYAAK
jgi:hypothetical protein